MIRKPSGKLPERVSDKRRRAEFWGRASETIAVIVLRLGGHHILARRWQSVAGEIDIVAQRGNRIIFIEVKFRQSDSDTALPTRRQQYRIIRAAQDYAGRNRISPNLEWRFDLIQIGKPSLKKSIVYRHIRNAWQADDVVR